jgi:hypothetical protein
LIDTGLKELMSDSWYSCVDAQTPLTQGDLISDCPVIAWAAGPLNLSESEEGESLKGATIAIRADVVVMTQACDLENNKVDNVILCPHISVSDYRKAWEEEMRTRQQNPTTRAWGKLFEDIRDGYVWNLTILNAGESGDLKIEHRVVDFHDVYTIPRSFLESLLKQRGGPRLRLNPPYREHLSQAFARFFMRVGLPVPVTMPS